MHLGSKAELDAIRAECRALVNRSAGLSGAAAALPVPAADLGVDVSLLLSLIPAINRRFGLSPDQVGQLDVRSKQLLLVGVTSVGSQLIGKAITARLIVQVLARLGVRITLKAAAKWVPIVGQAAAAAISFATMRFVGLRHVEDCYRVALKLHEPLPVAERVAVALPSGAVLQA